MQSGGPPNSPRGVLALLASSRLWRQHSSSDQQPEIGPDCTPSPIQFLPLHRRFRRVALILILAGSAQQGTWM
ncbi:uncharacterized protein K444DRAFT_615047 [Hyaloscypha bicolor E]|uniref:Uncharacterized protein n=1 Tax=Hyaloscypha bicolor E TaxID=1095630 RepID=A0A2J6T3Z4_9HELO|nr:uncharacterized protein K444DRAFT_615047 [Hyaloscypha bicolor E]PMD57643.1 hypothetical protein K444DRAFT_615047 [Hyaloscypha bicolor E]